MTTRVMVVDDSAFVRKALARVLSTLEDVEVVGQAASGREAIEQVTRCRPDVVTLDVDMPGLDGLATLRELQRIYRRAAVIMLSAHTQKGAGPTLEALSLGAVDFIDKRQINVVDFERLRAELAAKLGAALAMRATRAKRESTRPAPTATPALALDAARFDLCVIGASTGGPPALQHLLTGLPADFALPILVVQHMPAGFTRPFADRLAGLARIGIREAAAGDRLAPGLALVAPAGQHLEVRGDGGLTIDPDGRGALHVPSVDVTMTAAVRAYGSRVLGVLLTGMGKDGADGMVAIRKAGGVTLAESEATCVVYGMPRAAVERGAVDHLLPLPDLGAALRDVRTRGGAG